MQYNFYNLFDFLIYNWIAKVFLLAILSPIFCRGKSSSKHVWLDLIVFSYIDRNKIFFYI